MSLAEALELLRAMVADRTRPEGERSAMLIVVRAAERGRRISSSTLPAIGAGMQHFLLAREHINRGVEAAELGLAVPAEQDDE